MYGSDVPLPFCTSTTRLVGIPFRHTVCVIVSISVTIGSLTITILAESDMAVSHPFPLRYTCA